jgi:hypothetical protein
MILGDILIFCQKRHFRGICRVQTYFQKDVFSFATLRKKNNVGIWEWKVAYGDAQK